VTTNEFHWGYLAAALAFVLSTVQAAPAVALASRLASGAWGIPARPLCDAQGLAALITAPVGIVLLTKLPDFQGRPSIWFDWPGAPLVWHTLAYLILALVALALAGVAFVSRRTAWRGGARQWRAITWASAALGSLYLMQFVLLHVLVASDFALSLVPGWSSGNFPAYHAISALQGGVATTVLLLALVSRGGQRVPRESFHACARLLLALALLWFYFTWSEFLTYWYGRTPQELELLSVLMFGPTSLPLFVVSACLCCLVPVALLIWNPIRGSVAGTTLVAALVVIGLYVDRIRIFSAAWSVPVQPGLLEGVVLVGVPALALLLAVLTTRLVRAVPAY
jgi:hypothetical protein